jgi:hypothetical protein
MSRIASYLLGYCNVAINWLKKNAALTGAVLVVFISGKEGSKFFLVLCPGLGVDAIAHAGAFDSTLNQTGVLQLFEMLRDGGLGEAELVHQLPANAGIGLDQGLDDGDAGRVGEGLHHARELVLFVGEYFGFGQAHVVIVSLQYYDDLVNDAIFFDGGSRLIISVMVFLESGGWERIGRTLRQLSASLG